AARTSLDNFSPVRVHSHQVFDRQIIVQTPRFVGRIPERDAAKSHSNRIRRVRATPWAVEMLFRRAHNKSPRVRLSAAGGLAAQKKPRRFSPPAEPMPRRD